MQEQHLADKVAVAVGTGASALIGLDFIQTGMALIIAVLTIALLGFRIALARREWRGGRKPTPEE